MSPDWAVFAAPTCTTCKGSGLLISSPDSPCGCSLRRIARIVHRRYRQEVAGRFRRNGRTFAADVEISARRTLTDPLAYHIFAMHVIEGLDSVAICARLGLVKYEYFNRWYSVESRLGHAYATSAPYSLLPREYMGLTIYPMLPCRPPQPGPRFTPVRPPLRPVALPAPAMAPEAVPMVLEPVVIDPRKFAKLALKNGKSLRSIVTELNAIAPGSGPWRQSQVKRLLLAA